jgi:hypothetical protein
VDRLEHCTAQHCTSYLEKVPQLVVEVHGPFHVLLHRYGNLTLVIIKSGADVAPTQGILRNIRFRVWRGGLGQLAR